MSLSITGSTISAATSVTLPGHNVGDLIVIFAHRGGSLTPIVPSAAGTVPAWSAIDTMGGTTAGSLVTADFVATATNHTSGIWTNATGMIAVVISGNLAASPIGGHAAAATGGTTTSVTAPAVTLSRSDGSSVELNFYGHPATISSWGSAPAGYSRMQATTGSLVCCNSKNDTTSDGSIVQSLSATATGGATATVEILAVPSAATVLPTAVASAGAFGTATVGRGAVGASPTGVASGQAFGAATVNRGAVSLALSGVVSAQSFGAASVGRGAVTASPTGISSAGAFGSTTVTSVAAVSPTGIPSGQVFGGATVEKAGTQLVEPSGIASSGACGTPTVGRGAVNLAASGIASAAVFGTAKVDLHVLPGAIDSGELFGDPDVGVGAVTVSPVSVAPGQIFGDTTVIRGFKLSPTGIPGILGILAFGTPTVVNATVLTVALTAISSGEAFGGPSVSLPASGGQVLHPLHISSVEVFGRAALTGGVAAAIFKRSYLVPAEDRTTTVTGPRSTIIT